MPRRPRPVSARWHCSGRLERDLADDAGLLDEFLEEEA
jgi:hypothetical protein